MPNKGMSEFRNNGEDFTLNDPNIANEYSNTAIYAEGDYFYHNGTLRRSNVNIPTGESFDSGKSEQRKLATDHSYVNEAIRDMGFVELFFEQAASQSHSSATNQLKFNAAAGETLIVDVRTESGEVLSSAVVAYNASGTNVGEVWVTTGTPKMFRLENAAVKFGVYLSAPTNATRVTFRVARTNSLMYYPNEMGVMLGMQQTRFFLPNAESHSSLNDQIVMEMAKNEQFDVLVKTNNNSAFSGALVAFDDSNNQKYQFGITTGTKRTIKASEASTRFGVYLTNAPANETVTFSIIKHSSILYNSGNEGGTAIDALIPSANNAIKKVYNLQNYNNGVSFAFITDMHWETNWQTSPELMDYIADNSRLDLVFNGGDVASGDDGNGTDQKKWLNECTSAFHGKYRYYTVNGNHDNNSIGGTAISAAQVRSLILPNPADVDYGSGNYYTFKYGNTRFICLDTGTNGYSDSTQVTWAKNVIEAAQEDYIIFIMHMVYAGYGDSNPVPLFQDLMTMIDALAEDDKDKIQAIFAGHLHHDVEETFSGIPVIMVDTDSRFPDDGISRVQGTDSAQCFDLVVVNYDSKKISCVRIGSIGQDRTINY